jgi:DNA topoisomerase-1
MKLIIVESPTKAKTLGKFLGKDFAVEATYGHIKDLPKTELGIDLTKNFEPAYIDVPKRAKDIKLIKSQAKKADEVYIATDPDREGEAIASHVAEFINSKDPKRITFHEITKEAVEEAIANPTKIDRDLVDAQVARRVLDRLVGYKLSPLLWRKVRRGLSAGRVQSVAVKLIVEKEREIEAFKPVEFWRVIAKLKAEKGNLEVELSKIEGKKAIVSDGKTAKEIKEDLDKASYVISAIDKKEVRKRPYPPFTTSTMSQAAARVFGWSAKRTMSNAQKLYEEGLITYHRTDSTNISMQAINKVCEFIVKKYGKEYLPEKPIFYKTTSKVAQEAHEAIRPTNLASTVDVDASKFGRDQNTLYTLIWNRFVACQMNPAIYDVTTVNVTAKGKKEYLLTETGQIIKFDGWRILMPSKADTEEVLVKIPEITLNEILKLLELVTTQMFTEPPARFNEASLIKTLEKLGIGRPSTYAPIISTIQLRNYVEKTEGKFFPTPVGVAVNDFLMTNFTDTFDYAFTANMENELDSVANGKLKWQKPISDFFTPFEKKLEHVGEKGERVKIETEKLGRKCPECKEGELVIRIGRFGKFISCDRFPECKHTEKLIEKVGMKCPECGKGDVIVRKTGRGKRFYGCSLYPECKYASWKNPKLQKETPAK